MTTPKNKLKLPTAVRGRRGESIAVDFLLRNGYRILDRNFRFDRGEIDIIAEDGPVFVFIEVKARRSPVVGSPEDSITHAKRRQILKVAEGYLMHHKLSDRECRFDVITVCWENEEAIIKHLKDIF